MTRWRFLVLGLAALMLSACGGADREEEGLVPPPTDETLLVWQDASYAVVDRLPPEALDADGLEELGEARFGPGTAAVYFWPAGARGWELITREDGRWLVWEPRAVAVARRDLAERLSLSEAELETRRVERVQWPDACLGAPLTDEVCAQVITEGFSIELAAGAKTYRYHSDLALAVRRAP